MLNHESAHQSMTPSPIPSALGSRGIRFFGRIFNPLVLAVAGRRWMPLVGVLHHAVGGAAGPTPPRSGCAAPATTSSSR